MAEFPYRCSRSRCPRGVPRGFVALIFLFLVIVIEIVEVEASCASGDDKAAHPADEVLRPQEFF
jgi:hypothetical protein